MYKPVSHTRAALMGLLFAMVGFSYALATSVSSLNSTAGVGSRIVGSAPLRFTNPTISGDRDLGLVTLGSSLVRTARATGGVRPYTFTSSVSPSLTSVITGSTATLDLLQTGVLQGSLGNLAAAAFPLRFSITVTDSFGTQPNQATDIFRLTLDVSGQFKFAVDSLSEGVQYQPYFDIIPVINGTPVSVTATSATLGGAAVPNLESVGLTLNNEGRVYGKPFRSGTLVFTANARDAAGNLARSRDGSTFGQVITLPITANQVLSSDFITTQVQIKIDSSKTGKDSIKFAALTNLGANRLSQLRGEIVELRIGAYVTPNSTNTPATLDDRGKIAKAPKGTPKTAVTLKGSINSKGQVKLNVGRETLSGIFGTIAGAKSVLGVSLRIGEVLNSSETLEFEIKQSKSKSTLTYKIGTAVPGGNFMITDVKGKDDKKGAAEATAFSVNFIAQPAADVNAASLVTFTQGGFDSPTSASVSIGTTFVDSIGVEENKNKLKSDKGSNKSPEVTSLKMDAAKGKGNLKTGPLPTTLTGIREAGNLTGNQTATFTLNISLIRNNAVVHAFEGSSVMFPKKNNYSTKNPNK